MPAKLKTEHGLGTIVCMRSSSSVGESSLRTRHCGRLVVGTGTGALPVMEELKREANDATLNC